MNTKHKANSLPANSKVQQTITDMKHKTYKCKTQKLKILEYKTQKLKIHKCKTQKHRNRKHKTYEYKTQSKLSACQQQGSTDNHRYETQNI